jgi:D-lactate dehydrogenase
MSFPNVLITAHQAFFTEEALTEIAQVTLNSISMLQENKMPAQASVLLT